MQSVECFDRINLFAIPINLFATSYDDSIYFQNVKQFKIKHCSDETLSKIPIQFSQLKEFESILDDNHSVVFLTFINENRMIEKLTFNAQFVFPFILDGRLLDMLPFLKNIIYTGYKKAFCFFFL